MALFEGTAPLIATLLVDLTGWRAAPGAYLALTAVLAVALLPILRTRDKGGA